MDTHGHPPTDVNPQELSRAIHGWANFGKFATYGVLHVIALLVLMAIFLL
ncbi:MAG: hypothetical protein JWO78_1292 [Micavibrio sp.]|nr:hypothetical protein [Micavibrio sp.]